MDKSEIISNNKLIAEFLGGKINISNEWNFPNHYTCCLNGLMYHANWDWLIPVVEKIWKYIGNRESLFYFDNEEDCRIFPPIEHINNKIDCYMAVIEFIKWYNEQK